MVGYDDRLLALRPLGIDEGPCLFDSLIFYFLFLLISNTDDNLCYTIIRAHRFKHAFSDCGEYRISGPFRTLPYNQIHRYELGEGFSAGLFY